MMANIMMELSNAMTEAINTASPGVVRVEGRRRMPATGILWSADGVIVTANHVVRRDDHINVGLDDGRSVPAILVGRDPATDIAVLRVEAGELSALVEANKQELGIGNLVLALGRPGKTVQATLGIVSALGNNWQTQLGGRIDRYLQTDVLMYPGFSGGPLVDGNGRLLGMNTSGIMGGVSLAIPTYTLSRVADTLLTHGRMKRGYLGVSTQKVRLPDDLHEELGQKTGLLIVSTESNSPAAQGGLTLGDTIVGIAGEKVRNHEDLLAQLTGDVVETAVSISIIRGGKIETFVVTIGEKE
ncbi:MAG: trypsin-like peptidase domain-containing protein [Anaerolineae bacterium]|nr:trypsin-like peptidase domain-containing protein [Anaerolineae bacterium]